ncbi:putative helicase MAGATAMA 3 [Silene latifolia]|uniref:putative helicase MAGATAMA 3 n=1 Tax=Silene latifolia TaxID=37657 RepID=UPI003D76D268
MGSRGRPFFDLNETPVEEDEDIDGSSGVQPQKVLPSLSSRPPDLPGVSVGQPSIGNNSGFSHASSVSGFQPFVRSSISSTVDRTDDQARVNYQNSDTTILHGVTNDSDSKEMRLIGSSSLNMQTLEKEEGEWSDGECTDPQVNHRVQEKLLGRDNKLLKEHGALRTNTIGESNKTLNGNIGGASSMVTPGDSESVPKQKEIKGSESSAALKSLNNSRKHKLDEQKEAMLGKKRLRKTVFINIEDAKQAATAKSSTPRKQSVLTPSSNRTIKGSRNVRLCTELNGEKPNDSAIKDQNQVDLSCNEERSSTECVDGKSESNSDVNAGLLARPRRLNSYSDLSMEGNLRQNSWKQPSDSRQYKDQSMSSRKLGFNSHASTDVKPANKKNPPKRQTVTSSNQYHDTSVERLLREVTSEKFWHNPEESELQCVPGQFESVEEYIRVFEPLLFEECRAQLYSTWEELTETSSRDAHVMVRIKSVERRERGWYDVIVLPANEAKWSFKEGDVAVLSTPRPSSARYRRNTNPTTEESEEAEGSGRVVGTVRRHIPLDVRDPLGAILHFFVGDSYDPNNSTEDNGHILRKLQPRGIWFLSVLGALATTQREYVALHAFRRLNVQMQNAILKPSPEHFPKYEEQTPAIPECFTPNFIEHIHRTFNGPQLSAIQWAAMHTAAGTSNGLTKKQDPWPFTLVQGPPGTGKTHTVWGMLNVIHLVQYQHYYTALLKKLAPESYKQNSERNTDITSSGSIDEVLRSMDENLFRTLPKLCPKPRMLVCAPSNAATDELLGRVLDRGFIDGEMKVYRPDVARVGVDSQTRAAQAVSVERRTEQLLVKTREEIFGWLQQLKGREAHLSHQMASLQRQLNAVAVAGRSQGSVGVDPDVLMARDQNRDACLQTLAAVVEERDKVLVELSRLLILEGKFRPGSSFNLEEARASLETSFANEAEIVFTTLSSSGRKLFSRLTHGFDMVVIDEAAQASEVGLLPPLSLGAARCVLVGDPQQLPATVISKAAGTLLYSRSLFERFQQAGCPTMLLSVQYRMHPQIRDFPSRYFYQGRLTDSESVVGLPDERYHQDPLLKPYLFYDITHGRESHRGGSVSFQNVHEAQICLSVYEHLQKTVKSLGLGKITVGIITPYKLQLKCLQREFADVLNSEEGKDLYINTVDAFQGQERDVIIMSCVRASSHGVGFVADIRRMNVALTRARRALWVMGNANALVQSDDWAALIADAKARNCYMDMDSLPKELLVTKGPAYDFARSKFNSGARGSRQGGPRSRLFDISSESKPGTLLEEDKSKHFSNRKD